MKRIVPLVLALLLAGCGFTGQGDFVREQISERGAQAMDEGLVNAEWFLCNAASIGSIKRRYGVSDDRAETYSELCGEVSVLRPAAPSR